MTDTYVHKTIDGWKATTDIELGPVTDHSGRPGERVLRFSTSKYNSNIVTRASVHVRADGFESFAVSRDFSMRVRVTQARCTEKTVRESHNAALLFKDDIVEKAKAHYAKEPTE